MIYDVTTLYFETDKIDEHCEKGFFKDARHSQPQIFSGLLVSKEGYLLSYSIFNDWDVMIEEVLRPPIQQSLFD